MRVPKPLIPVSALFEESPDLSYLRDMPRKEPRPKPERDEANDFQTAPVAKKALKNKTAGVASPQPMAQPVQPARQPFSHHETGQPTLAQRVRPDLPHGHVRQQQHLNRYNDQTATADRVRHLGSSANPVFHSQMSNGHQTVLKPLNTVDPNHQPDRIGARNAHLYDFLSSVGAHHMGTPNFVGNFHSNEQLHKRHPHPDESDSPEKQVKMARSHAGQPAHVIEFSPGEDLKHSSQADIDSVDDEHRLYGALAHTMFSNTDGHGGNIRLAKGPNGKVHPVLFDNDVAGQSVHQQAAQDDLGAARNPNKGDVVRSHFLPGGALAYDKNGKQWGNNFPPAVQAQLHSYARGEHFGQHGIHPDDAAMMQRNAQDLLTHGLEGTLQRRHVVTPSGKLLP